MSSFYKEIVEFTQTLVSIPSYESERAIAEVICHRLSSFGFNPKRIGSDNHPSVICSCHRENSNKTIWLQSHLDTAPLGDVAKWYRPPLQGTIVGNKIYGRGVADSKVAIGIFTYLAKSLIETPDFQGSIFLGFDAEEETGKFTGIKEILKHVPRADVCILGYQGIEEISIGARGWLRFKLTTFGKSAHTGSRSKKGINAVHTMIRAASAILSLDLDAACEPFFEFGSSLNISIIKGGEAVNVIPDKCEAYIDIRLIPSQNKEQIIQQIENQLAQLKAENNDFQYELELLQYEPAYLSSPHAKFVQILHRNVKEIVGKDVPLVASGPGSVGNAIGRLGIPIINSFGCESGNVHAPNEWVNLESIPKVFEIYQKTLREFSRIQQSY